PVARPPPRSRGAPVRAACPCPRPAPRAPARRWPRAATSRVRACGSRGGGGRGMFAATTSSPHPASGICIGVTGRPLASRVPQHLVDGLRDAHAMEQQAEQMLKTQASRIENYPKMKARVEQHLEETRGQQKLLEDCLERLGSTPSAVKDTMGTMAAMGQGMAG